MGWGWGWGWELASLNAGGPVATGPPATPFRASPPQDSTRASSLGAPAGEARDPRPRVRGPDVRWTPGVHRTLGSEGAEQGVWGIGSRRSPSSINASHGHGH